MNWRRSLAVLIHFVWRGRAGEENICLRIVILKTCFGSKPWINRFQQPTSKPHVNGAANTSKPQVLARKAPTGPACRESCYLW